MSSGGWIEQIEVEINALCDDSSALSNSKVKEFCTFTKQIGIASGRDLYISKSMKELIEQAGFVNVQERKLKLPLGSWATDPKLKDIGRFHERFYKTGLQGWLLQICTRTLGVSGQSSDRRIRLLTREIPTLCASRYTWITFDLNIMSVYKGCGAS
jgi:hypothetical protein